MRMLIVFTLLATACMAAPQINSNINPNDITIVSQEEHNNIGVDGYHFSYEQSDGQKREETAVLTNQGTDDEAIEVTGSFSFTTYDGKTYRVDYKADKDGFHPTITLVA